MGRIVFFASMLLLGCQTEGVLKTSSKAVVFSLADDYSRDRKLGETPVSLPVENQNLRLVLDREDAPSEIAFVLFPDDIDGEINLPLSKESQAMLQTPESRRYFDVMLRIQRMIFRGQLKEAEGTLAQYGRDFGRGFSFFVLKGLLAARRGDSEDAKRLLRVAHGIHPAAEELKSYFQGGG